MLLVSTGCDWGRLLTLSVSCVVAAAVSTLFEGLMPRLSPLGLGELWRGVGTPMQLLVVGQLL